MGTLAMTGAIWAVQHDFVLQALKLQECQEAARLWSGIGGLVGKPVGQVIGPCQPAEHDREPYRVVGPDGDVVVPVSFYLQLALAV